MRVEEEAVEALRELLEIAVEMKRSGVLGMLRRIAEAGEKVEMLIASDEPILRLIGLTQALLGGAARLEPGDYARARRNAEEAVECLLHGLSRAGPAGAPSPGLLGLLGALRDPAVRKGLGLLLEIARGLGECALRKEGRG